MKLTIKVIPNAKKDEIIQGNPLTVKTKYPPWKGKANKAVEKLLSKYFNTQVTIIKGGKSKTKVVEIMDDVNAPKENSLP